MSYRSLKRVLGETNLERKCRLLFGLCLFVLITGSFWWYGTQTEKLVKKQNRKEGRLLVDTIMTLHHWRAWETDEEQQEERVPSEAERVLFGPLIENLKSQRYDWSILRPPHLARFAGRGADLAVEPQDEFERDLLARFVRAAAPAPDELTGQVPVEYEERYVNEGREYQYFQTVRATEATCIECHIVQSVNLELVKGNLLAVIKVKSDTADTRADLAWNRAILMATAIVTVFLAMIVAYVIVRYVIVKPLKHLRDVSDAISRGDTGLRADIQTGDEFEELGVAFNRMLGHLLEAQKELRGLNTDLDSKVDQLAQVNMRLFETNRLKSDFLATMSHELRTPLNSIIGFSDVLASGDSLAEKQRRYVDNIQTAGRMLLEMINDILDLAKIESGKMEIRPIDFHIGQIIEAQCDLTRPLAEKKNLALETHVRAEIPELHQDQGKLQQILNNLLSNAIKFTPEGGRIDITAHLADTKTLEMVVSDTGVGISETDQKTIFEKFRQGNTVLPGGDAMTREYSGTGLGLSIVRELCRLLGGEIFLESELGKGSSFTVRLPLRISEQPRRDSPLAQELDELTRPRRLEFQRATTLPLPTVSSGE